MMTDFLNFFGLYLVLVIMFGVVGCFNFMADLTDFETLVDSSLRVFGISLGDYDLQSFDKMEPFQQYFGQIFIIIIVIVFKILILNLIIAILSNTYAMFDSKSIGLYLSKILNSRDEFDYDKNYGAFLLSMTPLNIVVLPAVPFALFCQPSELLNKSLIMLQYCMYIVVIYAIFLFGSLILFPFAFLRAVYNKFSKITRAIDTKEALISLSEFIIFLIFGLFSMALSLLADGYYFWVNNFRTELKKIIINKVVSKLSTKSIREIRYVCQRLGQDKIRSVRAGEFTKFFQNKYNLYSN